ncbi:MAG: hypothetical protein U5R49_16975 [Deltaproteobacteria bacterium]|nr:hypothetical protein [Deltaproteobacteria bacterium]
MGEEGTAIVKPDNPDPRQVQAENQSNCKEYILLFGGKGIGSVEGIQNLYV